MKNTNSDVTNCPGFNVGTLSLQLVVLFGKTAEPVRGGTSLVSH